MATLSLYQYYAFLIQKNKNFEEDKKNRRIAQPIVQQLKIPMPSSRLSIKEKNDHIENSNDLLKNEQAILQRKQNSPLFFKLEKESNSLHLKNESITNNENLNNLLSNKDAFGQQLTSIITPSVKAQLLPNRNFLITKGTFFDCVMQTAIDTTVAGFTSCLLSQDVYSDNGKVILLERGTQFTGELKTNLHLGQKRVFILWTRAKTPKGVIVNLDSPASDALGRAGIMGEVDNHFWDRFGAALMLSFIQDEIPLLLNQEKGNATTAILWANSSNKNTELMSNILNQTINIPPILKKPQGSHINIIVARDLDFNSVYDLRIP
ncbi:MAG: hypothetical protein LEGION0398_MBIBDBAK_01033 [Legionellaceae bacterium]